VTKSARSLSTQELNSGITGKVDQLFSDGQLGDRQLKTIFKAFFLLIALSLAIPVIAQPDFEAIRGRAETGDAWYQNWLGVYYAEGIGVAQNSSEAVKWYRLSAEQGLAAGQVNLGLMYEHGGGGLLRNHEEAVRWYKMAAAQGYASGQNSLGEMYQMGKGTPQNYREAVRLYSLAAEQGFVTAQFNLGLAYGQGKGIAQDAVRAYFWLSLAASQGHVKAAEARNIISRDLPSQLLDEVQALATGCFEVLNLQNCGW